MKASRFEVARRITPPEPALRQLLHRTESSKLFGLSLAGALLVLVGLLDYLVGYEVGFALFYLFPVMLSTWAAGRWAGIGAATICALLWLVADFAAGQPYREPLSPFLNATMRLGIFLLVAHLVMVIKNVVEFERKNSRTDHLTGIANRRAFMEALGQERIRSTRFRHTFSLVYIDIDNFKKLNDNMGHRAGDEALCVVVEILKQSIRSVDLVGRIGGDEFAILLPECGRGAAAEVVTRCFAAISRETRARDWPIGLSVGVGIFKCDDRSAEEMLACADGAMYQSKSSGKNRIHYVSFADKPVYS